jgi:hypothetical protein
MMRDSEFGGAEAIRTPDLLVANETLCQLSYDPIIFSTNDLRIQYQSCFFVDTPDLPPPMVEVWQLG